jgi:hypothetical protein
LLLSLLSRLLVEELLLSAPSVLLLSPLSVLLLNLLEPSSFFLLLGRIVAAGLMRVHVVAPAATVAPVVVAVLEIALRIVHAPSTWFRCRFTSKKTVVRL